MPTPITSNTMQTLITTITALKLALSLMPTTRITVTSAVMMIAGRSSTLPVATSLPRVGS